MACWWGHGKLYIRWSMYSKLLEDQIPRSWEYYGGEWLNRIFQSLLSDGWIFRFWNLAKATKNKSPLTHAYQVEQP